MRKLLATTVLGLSMVLASATFALAASTNPAADGIAGPTTSPDKYLAAPLTDTLALDDETNDTGALDATGAPLVNVNQSGVGTGGDTPDATVSVIKSQNMSTFDGTKLTEGVTQRTHGEYQSNTNSCASCHQTHTGAAKNLLIKNDVYSTCTACHDGTLGFYNVFSASSAGTFGGTAEGNASMHLPDATMEIKAAPGGYRYATEGSWTSEFTCASCHAPHGSYSDRLLAYNPNDIANEPASKGGLQLIAGSVVVTPETDKVPVVTSLPLPADITSTSAPIILYEVAQTDTANWPTDAPKTTTKPDKTVVDNSALIAMKLVADHGSYTYKRDINPWVAGGEYGQPKFTRFINFVSATGDAKIDSSEATSANQISGIKVNYAKGYATAPTGTFASAEKIVIARASFVKFVETSVQDPTSKVNVTKVQFANYDDAGLGVQITQFCAACHTDYQASSGAPSGVWSKAFRHTTTSDSYTCLKCHFAHGTDVSVMLDAKNNSVASLTATKDASGNTITPKMTPDQANAYMKDQNPSSALKRYTNMSVCWECHTQSHSLDLVNNQWIQGESNSAPTTIELVTGSPAPQVIGNVSGPVQKLNADGTVYKDSKGQTYDVYTINGTAEFNTKGTNVPSGFKDPSAYPYPN